MAEGAWQTVSNLLAQQANINRGKNDRVIQPADMNPYSEDAPKTKGIPINADNIGILKGMAKNGIK